MTFLKFSFLFVFALFLSQTTASPPVSDGTSELAPMIATLITKVTTFFDELLRAVMSFTTYLSKNGLAHFQKQTVDFAFKILGIVKKFLDMELDHIEPKLNADAKKVSKCLKDNGQEIIKVLVSYYNRTTICFNPNLSNVLSSVQPLLRDLDNVDKKIGGLAPMMSKCTNEICVFGVLRNLLVEVTTVGQNLLHDWPAFWTNLKPFINHAWSCAKAESLPWEQDSFTLYNKIATCFRS